MSNSLYRAWPALVSSALLVAVVACRDGEGGELPYTPDDGAVDAGDAETREGQIDPRKADAAAIVADVEPNGAGLSCSEIAEPSYDVAGTAFSNLTNASVAYKAAAGGNGAARLALFGVHLTMRDVARRGGSERQAVLVARLTNCSAKVICPELSFRAEVHGDVIGHDRAGSAMLAFLPEIGASGLPQQCVAPGQTFYAFAELDSACFGPDDISAITWSDSSKEQPAARFDTGRWVDVGSTRVVRQADRRLAVRASLESKRFTGYIG